MYPPNSLLDAGRKNSFLHHSGKRDRDRDNQGIISMSQIMTSLDGRPPIGKRKKEIESATHAHVPTSAPVSGSTQMLQRLQSQQQEVASRMNSLEMTLGSLLQEVADEVSKSPIPHASPRISAKTLSQVSDTADSGGHSSGAVAAMLKDEQM